MSENDMYARALTIAAIWTRLRPKKKFYGMSVDEFRALIAPSGIQRARLESLKGQAQKTLAKRNEADRVTRRGVQRIVNAIKGDPEEGEDSDLLEPMGYVPHTARSSINSAARRRVRGSATAADVEEDDGDGTA